MMSSILHAEESFHPEGTWTIQFQNSCSGSSTYSRRSHEKLNSVKGGEFVCSSYLPQSKLPKQDELHLNYHPELKTVELTGGPSTFPRTIHLDQDRVGVSSTRLFPKTTSQSPTCDVMSYDLETVKFTNSNHMFYGFVTVFEMMPRHNHGCDSYLGELKTAIKRRTATGLLLAMRDAHAINVDQLKNLAAMNVFENYTGTRRSQG
jgi:hypothetical protein